MDMRGFGASTIPSDNARWSMELLVSDVFAVARAAGAERFHFVGESMGGTVGLCSYLLDAKAIRTITVSNGAHIGATLNNLNDWRDVIQAKGMRGWSEMMTARRFYGDGLKPAERAWFTDAQAACSTDSCLNALGVLRGIDLTARLSEISAPVLILHGDSSPTLARSFPPRLPRSCTAGFRTLKCRSFTMQNTGSFCPTALNAARRCGHSSTAVADDNYLDRSTTTILSG
jgi:pimeloyl-ACP methyl ester carboxylesterase